MRASCVCWATIADFLRPDACGTRRVTSQDYSRFWAQSPGWQHSRKGAVRGLLRVAGSSSRMARSRTSEVYFGSAVFFFMEISSHR